MNTIAPGPYVVKNGQGYKTEEGSDESAQDALSQDSQNNRGGQQQGGRGQNREPKTIARGRAAQSPAAKKSFPKHPPSAHQRKPITMGANKEAVQRPIKNQTAPQQVIRPQQPQMPAVRSGMPAQPVMQRPMLQQQIQQQPVQQQVQQTNRTAAQVNPQAQHQAENMARNNKVNIAQVIKDFRGTCAAIGTPKCLVDEIEGYLEDVTQHTKGEAPSINYVQTNLQNAAVILDKYISETLEKESRVVQNWLDALFLQRINYRYNDGEINQDFLVKFPKDNEPQNNTEPEQIEEPAAEQVQEIPDYEPIPEPKVHTVPIEHAKAPQQNVPREQVQYPLHRAMPAPKPAPVKRKKPQITIIPQDNELKALFVQAKKQAYSNNPAKAMNIFRKALQRAVSINDCETQSKICYEMGKIYDDNNYLVQALNNYNKSLNVTTDTTIKTKAHYSMAKIYDDVNQIDSAINHYMTSVSYAGVDDDLSSQSKSLTNIANIYTDKYNQDAFIFYDEANILINQTNDAETKGYVSSNTAGAFNKFNKPDKALKCYANAVKNYSEAKVSNSVAENYKSAGELMYDLGNPAKAKILLRKALAHTNAYKDAELINRINDLLEEIG
ncbi:MAG: hypothetical protein LUB59_00590 [Candidatus Gastranaerophilales bacterium]|nr:hypothetical protein [Candidatus Gastranaerophilales bacterium]